MTAEVPRQDGRKFFVLPQGYEGGGYYTYGTPDQGRSQYAHPDLITLIGFIASEWTRGETRKFGIGNISLADGVRHPDHRTHRSGLEVDIRPLRKDGGHLPCTINDPQYDHDATKHLIRLFFCNNFVRHIIFNDPKIEFVRAAPGHHDHFHVALRLNGIKHGR